MRRRKSRKLGALTSNAELDKFRFVFRKKQDGHTLSVYDGKTLIGKVGAMTEGRCYPDDSPLAKYRKHANVVSAEILEPYRGRKLYQEMLLRLRQFAKQELGCSGLKSAGFQRSPMATRAWKKLNPRVEVKPDEKFGREDLFLDGLGAIPTPRGRDLIRVDKPWGAEFWVYEGDKPVAFAATRFTDVAIDGRPIPTLQFDWLKVEPDWERKKVSTWLTERVAWWAESRGRALQSDWTRTKSREPFWEKQMRKGRVSAVVANEKGQRSYILPVPAPDSLDGLPTKGRIPLATVKRALSRLPAKTKACGFTAGELREGMEIEREHRDVTKGAVGTTAKIAAAHLCERRDYYKRIKKYVER